MFTARLRKRGKSLVFTVPREEIRRLNLTEGQLVSFEIRPLQTPPVPDPELQQAFDASWDQNEAGYRHLADR